MQRLIRHNSKGLPNLKTQRVLLDAICQDSEIQCPLRKSPAVVEQYKEAMLAGDTFPPVHIIRDGDTLWLADGFHRVSAAILAGRAEIDAVIVDGTKQAAVEYAAGANVAHGFRRDDRVRDWYVARLVRERREVPEVARICRVGAKVVELIQQDFLDATAPKRLAESVRREAVKIADAGGNPVVRATPTGEPRVVDAAQDAEREAARYLVAWSGRYGARVDKHCEGLAQAFEAARHAREFYGL